MGDINSGDRWIQQADGEGDVVIPGTMYSLFCNKVAETNSTTTFQASWEALTGLGASPSDGWGYLRLKSTFSGTVADYFPFLTSVQTSGILFGNGEAGLGNSWRLNGSFLLFVGSLPTTTWNPATLTWANRPIPAAWAPIMAHSLSNSFQDGGRYGFSALDHQRVSNNTRAVRWFGMRKLPVSSPMISVLGGWAFKMSFAGNTDGTVTGYSTYMRNVVNVRGHLIDAGRWGY